jgi:hypothetical protein
MAFSRKPPATADEFIAAAETPPAPPAKAAAPPVVEEHAVPTPSVAAATPAPRQLPREVPRKGPVSGKPWEQFDRKATAKNVFNLRLNDYYLNILRHLAEQEEDGSMQRVCKRILLPELDKRAGSK